jgi:hypothetical protein
MTSQVFHGARAKVFIQNTLVGTFSTFTWGVSYNAQDVSILGAFATQEVMITGMNSIEMTASGYRIVEEGPFSAQMRMGKLQDLLLLDDIVVTVHDRLSNKQIAAIVGVKVTGFQNTVAAKSMTEITLNMRGTVLSDEEGSQGEPLSGPNGADSGAAFLP